MDCNRPVGPPSINRHRHQHVSARFNLRMKPPPFAYHDPETVADVVGLLGRLENTKLLAGGQSLMPMLNMRYVLPDHLIDLNRVEGLSYLREAGAALEIGAMTRQRALE